MFHTTHDIDSLRQECIDFLVESPQDYGIDEIGEVYCLLSGISLANFALDDVDRVRQYCIELLVEHPQTLDYEQIAEVYDILS